MKTEKSRAKLKAQIDDAMMTLKAADALLRPLRRQFHKLADAVDNSVPRDASASPERRLFSWSLSDLDLAIEEASEQVRYALSMRRTALERLRKIGKP